MDTRRNTVALAIVPFSWISAPLGILPVNFDGCRFVCSRRRSLYCKVLSVVIALVELWHLRDVLYRRTRGAMSGVHVLTTVSYLVGNTVIVLNVYYVHTGKKKLLRCLNEMHAADNFLRRSVRAKCLIAEIYIFVTALQVIPTVTYAYLKMPEFNFKKGWSVSNVRNWAYVTIRLCGKTTMMCTGIHYCVLCMILAALVRATNREIQFWCNSSSKSEEKLSKLRIFHAKLFFLSEEMTSLYGAFVVLNLVYVNIFFQASFFHMVTTAYTKINAGQVMWTQDHSYSMYWIFVDAIKALAFFYSAMKVMTQSKRTGPFVTKCLNQMPSGMHRDLLSCMCIETTGMKMKMTAGGLFCLDKEMLLTSVYTCTLNLAILMQAFITDQKAGRAGGNE
ncbi:Hypothetical predicted protein [Cloeon dipterum]|uniref:Gustatory receptor n=1 Tax=Cloeon dipterum TaxID=197152 RepID=A0A8S1CB35_9INSE|nr:Hypothetical predicted protein [Cloeon dipterum]